MSQIGTDNVNLKDGRTLTEVLEGLGTGGNSTPVDLKDYAKATDVKEVKDMIEQLIVDLKAGKYAINGEVKVEEIKETKTSK
jgi:hypothetical protein